MSTPTNCPFCVYATHARHVPGTHSTTVVVDGRQITFDADRPVMWFEPLNAVTPGHMLFVPAAHIEHGDEFSRDWAGVLTEAAYAYAHRVAHAAGFNLILNAGAAATQTIDHIHLHYVPRRDGDGLPLPWTGQENR